MKSSILFICISSLLLSCKSNDLRAIEGSWIDQESEMTEINVTEDNGDYWLEFYDGKFEISKDNTVEVEDRKFALNFDQSQQLLSIAGVNYIPAASSIKNKFLGTWEGPNETIFKISMVNGGLDWVVEDSYGSSKYYPKRFKNGFTFTYNDQDLKFQFIDNCIEDSNGNRYCKV